MAIYSIIDFKYYFKSAWDDWKVIKKNNNMCEMSIHN